MFVIEDLYVTNNITEEENKIIINILNPIVAALAIISVNDLKREIYISGIIESQQFGFELTEEFFAFLVRNKFRIAFSGISFLN